VSVKGYLELYIQQFKTTFAATLQYRASLVIWMISHVLEPLIYLIVWSTVSYTSGGSVGDYTTADFAAYFIVLMLVNHVTYTWIMYEFEYRVREGTFSVALLKPVHPIHSDVADNVSSKVITMPMMILIAVGLVVIFHPVIAPPVWAIIAAVPALFLAFLVRFFLEWTLAQAAFWTTRVDAINQVYFVLVLFLSGQIAPLTLFPPFVQWLANVLPFRWMIGFPVELLLGRVSPVDALTGVGVQIVWVAVAYKVLRYVWNRGVKVYSAVGA
jgi:ABC-2 type transport system permease protein